MNFQVLQIKTKSLPKVQNSRLYAHCGLLKDSVVIFGLNLVNNELINFIKFSMI